MGSELASAEWDQARLDSFVTVIVGRMVGVKATEGSVGIDEANS